MYIHIALPKIISLCKPHTRIELACTTIVCVQMHVCRVLGTTRATVQANICHVRVYVYIYVYIYIYMYIYTYMYMYIYICMCVMCEQDSVVET